MKRGERRGVRSNLRTYVSYAPATETTRLQHGSSMFGDTHAKGGGGGVSLREM